MKEKQTHSIPLESTCKITDEICLPDTKLPRVVIVGGGFAGLALVEKLKLYFHSENKSMAIKMFSFVWLKLRKFNLIQILY